MINVITLDVTSPTRGIIGHGTNCDPRGIMGSGVAKAVRSKWPEVYQSHCRHVVDRSPALGTVYGSMVADELYVVNMYTQENFGADGKRYASVDAIRKTFMMVCEMAEILNLPVYVPKLGCGLGGLSFKDEVEDIFNQVSNQHPSVEIFVCDL